MLKLSIDGGKPFSAVFIVRNSRREILLLVGAMRFACTAAPQRSRGPPPGPVPPRCLPHNP